MARGRKTVMKNSDYGVKVDGKKKSDRNVDQARSSTSVHERCRLRQQEV